MWSTESKTNLRAIQENFCTQTVGMCQVGMYLPTHKLHFRVYLGFIWGFAIDNVYAALVSINYTHTHTHTHRYSMTFVAG
jgi:hypothetical protein